MHRRGAFFVGVRGASRATAVLDTVLLVSIHCEGCKKKVKKVLHCIEGVYKVTIDAAQHKVTVTGRVADALLRRLLKSGKHATLWPVPVPAAAEAKKEKPEEVASLPTADKAVDKKDTKPKKMAEEAEPESSEKKSAKGTSSETKPEEDKVSEKKAEAKKPKDEAKEDKKKDTGSPEPSAEEANAEAGGEKSGDKKGKKKNKRKDAGGDGDAAAEKPPPQQEPKTKPQSQQQHPTPPMQGPYLPMMMLPLQPEFMYGPPGMRSSPPQESYSNMFNEENPSSCSIM